MLSEAREYLLAESKAIEYAAEFLDDGFLKAVELIYSRPGKVIVTGMGKSGLVGRKISATLTSTGTQSVFLHPGEAYHGDLGVLADGDTILTIAYSGETKELLDIFPAFKRMNLPIILLTGKPKSTLAQQSNVVIDIHVQKEIGPLPFVPTVSSTVTLAFGDVLSVMLLKKRGFTEEDFARFHPGGAIGKRLLTRISDLMHLESELPRVLEEDSMEKIILTMSGPNFGIAGVFNKEGQLLGVISDGDLRRAFKNHGANSMKLKAVDLMNKKPKTIDKLELAETALHIMEKHKITVLFVTEEGNSDKIVGLIHLHDIVQHKII